MKQKKNQNQVLLDKLQNHKYVVVESGKPLQQTMEKLAKEGKVKKVTNNRYKAA